MVRLSKIEKYFGLKARLYAKLERYNPSGSVKDRAALFMIRNAVSRGLIKQGSIVIEPTSGNTGISLSMLSAIYGYRAVIVMPESMSAERVEMIRAYGGEVVLTPAESGMSGAIGRAEELAAEIKEAYIPSQFNNEHNLLAHYATTGPEIYREREGEVDIFVCGVGTGGSFCGVGRFLKEKNPSVKLFAVEPSESAVLSGGSVGKHGIQGIGAGFMPPLFDKTLADGVICVSTEQARELCSLISKKEGIFAGVSSGASLFGAISLAKEKENQNKSIVTLFPDGGEKYLSVISV